MKRAIYRSGAYSGLLVGGVIYMITSTKAPGVYIGQTKEAKPDSRWRAHLIAARSGKAGKLYDAMREYGIESFSFQVIASVLNVRHLGDVEATLIEQYDSEASGYNAIGPNTWAKRSAEMSATHAALQSAIGRIGLDRVLELLKTAA